MANFIEELYYGNIKPQNVRSKESKAYSREMKVLSENEDALLERLPEEDKKLFLEYVDAWGIVDGESVVDGFINGFRLGARFTYDTFVSEGTDLLKEKWIMGKKYIIVLDDSEWKIVINVLNDFRNSLIQQGRYTDAVDDIMIKVINTEPKRKSLFWR